MPLLRQCVKTREKEWLEPKSLSDLAYEMGLPRKYVNMQLFAGRRLEHDGWEYYFSQEEYRQ